MDDLAFLEQVGQRDASNATLKAVLDTGDVCLISDNVCPYTFLDTCPLLYHAFEYGSQSRLYANIGAPSISAVVSLLRYCYTGTYLATDADYEPILLLQHIEIYKLAIDFDVPELQLLANANFLCQIEFSCCLPTPPQDLLETIKFVYQHYADQKSRQEHNLVETLLNYCVSQFSYHSLGQNAEFLQLVSKTPGFHRDLCRVNIERNFQDDCAFDIIKLALDILQPHFCTHLTVLASGSLPLETLSDAKPEVDKDSCKSGPDAGTAPEGDGREGKSNDLDEFIHPQAHTYPTLAALVYRPKNTEPVPHPDLETNCSSDEDGFSLVHRPKPLPWPTPDNVMSSPELVLSAPVDVLVATGSKYPSDDEWDWL